MPNEEHTPTACPRCSQPLCRLLFMGVQADGFVCLTCKLFYTDDLEPIELWRKLWATPERQGQRAIFADYTEGIEHPRFWAMCQRCRALHGPHDQLAKIRSLCQSCSEQDQAQLARYMQEE